MSTPTNNRNSPLWPLFCAAMLAGALPATTAQATTPAPLSSSCTSDGQPAPRALVERFTSANCTDCWRRAAAPAARPGDAVLDWVLPSVGAPSTALTGWASPEALERSQSLATPSPQPDAWQHRSTAQRSGQLRVAQGAVFNDYLGVSMTFKPGPRSQSQGPWTAWLALVELQPAAKDGSAMERRLVRQLLRVDAPAQAGAGAAFNEMRSMRVPDGAVPEQLRVVGWVQDGRRRLVGLAQTRCVIP